MSTPPKKSHDKTEPDSPNLQVRWRNFRGFRDSGWIVLRPLTILIGPNNAGKTSVMAPLLLLNQTIRSDDGMTPLLTKGPLIDAGNFQNIVTNHDIKEDLSFGIRFHVHEGDPKKNIGEYPPGSLEVTFKSTNDPYACVLKSYDVKDVTLRPFLKRTLRSNGRYSAIGIQTKSLTKNERRSLNNSWPVNFLFSPTRDIYFARLPHGDSEKFGRRFSDEFNTYLSIVGFVFNTIRSFLHELSYIGPIRERPRHFYESSADRPRTVGPSGERTPNLLRANFGRFRHQINKWVRRFEMGESIAIKEISDALFEIHFVSRKPPCSLNIADAGFGASQLLPLIVQACASEIASVTIAEQPEIHLNPRLQGTLADLFVEMANSGRRVVVETHSEHLVLRLRTLLALGAIPEDSVALYYVENIDGESQIRLVPISRNGQIDRVDWPKGFFGDTLKESLALADAQSKRSKK